VFQIGIEFPDTDAVTTRLEKRPKERKKTFPGDETTPPVTNMTAP
jgi:hypothetical protein